MGDHFHSMTGRPQYPNHLYTASSKCLTRHDLKCSMQLHHYLRSVVHEPSLVAEVGGSQSLPAVV